MATNQRDLVERLLRESILTLCRETISYKHCLEVDGIVCITAENEPQQIVIKVHEQIQRKTDGYETTVVKYENSSKSFTGGKMCYDSSPSLSLPPPPQTLPLSLTQSSGFSSKDCGDHINGKSSRSHRSDHQISMNGHVSLPESETLSQEPENCSMRSNLSLPISESSKHSASLNSPYETMEEHAFNRTLDNTPLSSKVGLPSNSDYSSSLLVPSSLSAVKPYTAIQCKRCDIVFPDAGAFEKHNLTEHSVFTCNICYRTFTARNNLKRHIRLHTGYKPYTCNICSNSFTRKDDLKFHLLKHNYDKPYRCNQCNKGYMDRSCLSNHMRNEHNCKLMHVCPQCGEGFNNTHVFMEHKKTHPELKEFQCTLCNFTGINSLMYQKHMLTHGHKKTYSCDPCGMQFDDPFTYTVHLKRHRIESTFNSYVCCFCENKLPTYKQFIRHEHSHAQSKTHACRLCHKQFRYPSNLREHMMVHDSTVETDLSKQYWCTECNQGFGSEDFLRCHIFEVHEVNLKKENSDMKTEFSDSHMDDLDSSDDDPYMGGLSEQERHRSSDKIVSREENDIDMNDNPRFDDRISGLEDDSALVINEADERDVRVTSKKPFVSPILNGDINIKQEYPDDFEDSTGSSDVLAMNESIRNSNSKDPSSPLSETKVTKKGTGTKPACFERVVTPEIPFRKNVPFTCKECGEVYQDFDGFESHSTIVHRRYVCEYCGKIFTSKPNRERHVRYHTGERPYKCDLCSQSFFRGDDLKYHRTTRHSDIRPFKCKECGLYFSWPKDLNRHLKTHTQSDL